MRIQFADEEKRPTATRCRSRTGAAAVEFAVIAPFLVVIVLGMIEVTRAIQVKNYLTDAARSGCRLAITPGNKTQNVTDNINTILDNNGLNSSFATVTVQVNSTNVDVAMAQKYDQISVKIALPISKVNWVTPLFLANAAVESETIVMMHQ